MAAVPQSASTIHSVHGIGPSSTRSLPFGNTNTQFPPSGQSPGSSWRAVVSAKPPKPSKQAVSEYSP